MGHSRERPDSRLRWTTLGEDHLFDSYRRFHTGKKCRGEEACLLRPPVVMRGPGVETTPWYPVHKVHGDMALAEAPLRQL